MAGSGLWKTAGSAAALLACLLSGVALGSSAVYSSIGAVDVTDGSRVLRGVWPRAVRASGGAAGLAAPARDRSLPAEPFPVLVVFRSAKAARSLSRRGVAIRAQVGRVASAAVDAAGLGELLRAPEVLAARAPAVLFFHLDVNGLENGAVAARRIFGASGSGAVVAIIDSGIDWTHADFRHPDGRTRIKALWDQFDDSYETSNGAVGSPPPVEGLGTVYTQEQIDAALEGRGTVASRDLLGHGTLVASAAAGNGRATGGGRPPGVYVGTAPEADLLVVRAGGLDPADSAITGDIVAALAWIDEEARALGKPAVVNMSFGGHVGPHDGTTPEEIAIDEFARQPGRAVVVSAGNEGRLNVHASGSAVGSHTLKIYQAGEADAILVDCWLAASDRVDLGFRDPSHTAGSWVVDANVRENTCETYRGWVNQVSVCLFGADQQTGKREVAFAVEPAGPAAPISAGMWEFVLRDEGGVVDGRFDCWSAFGQQFGADVDRSITVAQPGTAAGAITVGALAARDQWPSLAGPTRDSAILVGDLAPFSSAGPTADGRTKPDLVTGGQVVVGAWASGDGSGSAIAGVPPSSLRVAADGVHVAASGTSFSAPQVAGAVALLMAHDPLLDGASARAILAGTARVDAFTGAVPNDRWGYGKLDVAAALAAVSPLATPTPTSAGYPSPSATPTPWDRFALAGDANCDGVVTARDVVATTRAIFDGPGGCRADCSGDGKVGAADIACAAAAAARAGGEEPPASGDLDAPGGLE